MRNTVVLLLISFVSTGYSQLTWKHKTSDVWLNPETQKVDSAICFTALSCSNDTCTAVGMTYIRPSNMQVGFSFFRSTDGGISWNEQKSITPLDNMEVLNYGITKLQQIDGSHCIGIASPGYIIRTTNGGEHWDHLRSPVKRQLRDIHFSDQKTGILLSVGSGVGKPDSMVFTTTDGGDNWKLQPFQGGSSCYSYGNGKFRFWRSGYGPMFTTSDDFQTLDSTLLTYELINDPKHRHGFTRCTFGQDNTIFIYGGYAPKDTLSPQDYYGTVTRTTDGGKSWDEPTTFTNRYLSYVSKLTRVDRDTIYGIGGSFRHTIISTDRGKSWRPDSIIIDTNYETGKGFDIDISNDGHPIAIFGHPGPLLVSTIARGEYTQNKVEGIERITYFTSLSPNPTRSKLFIRSIDKMRPGVIISDLLGRDVMFGRLDEEGNATMDVSGLASGLYFVKLNHFGIVFIVGKVAVID